MYTQLQLRDAARQPVNLTTLNNMREKNEPIAALTCYDASFAVLLDQSDVDVVLVGDSLGMVIQGHDTTVPVTVDDMVYHTRAVARGTYRPFLVADLPFMSYSSPDVALANSVRLMQEGGARMVKLESGAEQLRIVEVLAGHDIAELRGGTEPALGIDGDEEVGAFRDRFRAELSCRDLDVLLLNGAYDVAGGQSCPGSARCALRNRRSRKFAPGRHRASGPIHPSP